MVVVVVVVLAVDKLRRGMPDPSGSVSRPRRVLYTVPQP